jgi:hypothetical protein
MKPQDTKPPTVAPSGQDPETTLDLLKALENAAIVIEEPPRPAPPPEPEPSYNPYDRGTPKPGRKRSPP